MFSVLIASLRSVHRVMVFGGYNIETMCFRYVGIALPVSLTFLDNVGTVARVNGTSMFPTLLGDQRHETDYVWLSSFSSRRFAVDHGDIIAFRSPQDPDRILIKRVVGLPGDVLKNIGFRQSSITVKEGYVWVEGDNKERSMDSNNFGPVPLGLMIAKATHIVWPPSRWSRLSIEKFERVG